MGARVVLSSVGPNKIHNWTCSPIVLWGLPTWSVPTAQVPLCASVSVAVSHFDQGLWAFG